MTEKKPYKQIKGAREAWRYSQGQHLTLKQSVLGHCYLCNGEDEGGNIDCQGTSCPLYPWFKKYFHVKTKKKGSSYSIII